MKKIFYTAKFAHFFDKNNRIFNKKITFNPGIPEPPEPPEPNLTT